MTVIVWFDRLGSRQVARVPSDHHSKAVKAIRSMGGRVYSITHSRKAG